MRWTKGWAPLVAFLALSATLLAACSRSDGAGEQRATAATRNLDSSGAAGPSGASERRAAEDQPPDSRTDERRRQDSVLRTPGQRQRKKLGSDST
jgi:hypothetical protein